jgi:hypothetical protein
VESCGNESVKGAGIESTRKPGKRASVGSALYTGVVCTRVGCTIIYIGVVGILLFRGVETNRESVGCILVGLKEDSISSMVVGRTIWAKGSNDEVEETKLDKGRWIHERLHLEK